MTQDKEILEETTEIQDAGHNIPKANLIIYGIITALCVVYAFLYL